MDTKYPYAGHDKGVFLRQRTPGNFTETPMTPAQLAAREPALAITNDIYRYANHAGVCYIEMWEIISKAIEGALRDALGEPTPTMLMAGDKYAAKQIVREAIEATARLPAAQQPEGKS